LKLQIPEEVELVWDDSVAPEACIDLDAPQMSTSVVLWSVATVATIFGALYTYVVLSDPEGSNPVAKRETVIPASYAYDCGMTDKMPEEDEEDEDDE
tara:strand:+ start:80 stop:370 length:291 start_codon:yes stop_codon:yes gene_type:complete